MNLFKLANKALAALHELGHFVPAFLFGLKPRMYINVTNPQTRYNMPQKRWVRIIVKMGPALAGIPIYLYVALVTYAYLHGFEIEAYKVVAIWLGVGAWLYPCHVDFYQTLLLVVGREYNLSELVDDGEG